MTKENSIFISIASYRDPEVVPTILDAIDKAKYKDNLHFGVLLQDDDTRDLSLIENKDNIKIIQYDWRESQGACWARSEIQESLFDNERYYFQLDSHHRFCPNWDELLIDLLEKLRKDFPKPILGGYCPSYNPKQQGLSGLPCKMNAYPDFTSQGDLFFSPKIIKGLNKLLKNNIEYIPARFLSGHFIFSDGVFCKECPYDPNLYFRGEELSLSARAYTSGYDLFHPTQCIVWHEYIRAEQEKHWNNHIKENGFLITGNQRSDNAKARVRALLNMEMTNTKFNKYGLGSKRSLHEYELYAGLDFKSRRVHKYAYDIKDIYKYPFVMSQLEWENGLMDRYKISFELDSTVLKEIKSPDSKVICIIPENKANLPVYRKDLKEDQIFTLSNKVYIDASMDEIPTHIQLVKHSSKSIPISKFKITDFKLLK